MAFLKFNKSELVNLSYSTKREIIIASKTGAYCNTSIVACNTRRYHGLLAVTLDRFGGDKFLLLSSLDESLIVNGKQFNLGIHCYGGVYEPRGHKYIIDFSADPVPQITYKIGEILFRKSLVLAKNRDEILIRFELLDSPSDVTLQLKPFLAFRNIHDLTHQNPQADLSHKPVKNGLSFRMYEQFPDLFLQFNKKEVAFVDAPCWYNNITYTDEYRRGFECVEDLYVPGYFETKLKKGQQLIFSAATLEWAPATLKRQFDASVDQMGEITNQHDQLVRCADLLINEHNGKKRLTAGFSWMYTGLLRETLHALPGLTLFGKKDPAEFEEILDNLIADEQERLFKRTTQVEAPLLLASVLQQYIQYGADASYVWNKYGETVKGIIRSYEPGVRKEVTMHPNGLLWAQMEGVALTWMNAYINGRPVTERAGYQVETNAFWYNSICFALEMEAASASPDKAFIDEWTMVRDLVKKNYQPMFWNQQYGCLADYVDDCGQNMDIRPNQIYAIWTKYSPVDEALYPSILRVVDNELVTSRGIRTLSPRDNKYKGVYEGSQIDRDLAYHQGSTRPFLLEPYIDVSFKIKGKSFWKRAQWLSEGFFNDLNKHGVGAFSELYDGDPPHEAHGAISSALSAASLLGVDYLLEKYKED